MAASVGRPRRASRELLQEAAFELFQHRGYRHTTVEMIARTAGFSRATFFNCFSSKAELFWLETDALIAELRSHLDRASERDTPPTLRDALLEFSAGLGSERIPWALQNYRLLEAAEDLTASGASRVLGLNELFQRYLGHVSGPAAGSGQQLILRRSQAAASTAMFVSALLGWIDDGVMRGSFGDRLALALIH